MVTGSGLVVVDGRDMSQLGHEATGGGNQGGNSRGKLAVGTRRPQLIAPLPGEMSV